MSHISKSPRGYSLDDVYLTQKLPTINLIWYWLLIWVHFHDRKFKQFKTIQNNSIFGRVVLMLFTPRLVLVTKKKLVSFVKIDGKPILYTL